MDLKNFRLNFIYLGVLSAIDNFSDSRDSIFVSRDTNRFPKTP